MNKLLNEVGGIVATEIHGLTSWVGETKKFYVKTDVNPTELRFNNVREHIIEVREELFEGSFWIIAFENKQ